jgi:hypothetical protein
MRASLLLLVLVASTIPFLAVTPTAAAVGTCWAKDNDGVAPECPHTFCYGTRWSWGNYYYECQYWIDVPPICRDVCVLP